MVIGRAVAKRRDAANTVAVPAVIRSAGSAQSVSRCERATFAFPCPLHSLPATRVAERRVAIGRRGQDQRQTASEVIKHTTAEVPRIALDDRCLARCAVLSRLLHILNSESRPPGLQLHTDRAATLMYRLDQRRRDPAHRVEHQLARLAIGGDRAPGDLGQHLRRVPVGLGHVTALALPLARPLRARPYRQRQPSGPAHALTRGGTARRGRGARCATTSTHPRMRDPTYCPVRCWDRISAHC